MPIVKLNKNFVNGIVSPQSGQVFYIDSSIKGFGIRVGKTAKAYYAEKRVHGKTPRVTIGTPGQITLDQARRKAQELLGTMAVGKNPNDDKKHRDAFSVTLEEAFKGYLNARKSLKPRTIQDYNYIMTHYFNDWRENTLVSISKDLVEERHAELGSRSHAQATYAMRFLRAIFNYAIGKYDDSQGNPVIQHNPVIRLSQIRSWYEVERRRTVITKDQLKPFMKAAEKLENRIIRDFLLFLLFTGLRKQEGITLKWEQVNFKSKTFTIQDTKNKEPLLLPMSDFIYNLLDSRSKERINEYVFPGRGRTEHLAEPRRQMAKVTEISGVSFTLHDFRRTFITIAESLDISSYAVKKLVNHKTKGDVTAGYVIIDVERLREPMQKITDYILEKAGVKAVK